MGKFLRVLFITLLTVLMGCLPIAMAAPDFLPVDQIQPGMTGIAKTVVSGTKIEEFNVEVLGVMKGKGPSGDLILVKTSGSVIDRTGGIAEGMSGSPVYIQGKLVGAIAYGWPNADHRVGMVTPIGDMIKTFDFNPTTPTEPELIKEPEADNAAEAPDQTGKGSDDGPEEAEPGVVLKKASDKKTRFFAPLNTPLMVSGYSAAALDRLTSDLAPLHLVPFSVGDAPSGTNYGPIEPGSAIGVQLVRGDVSIGALGTVTYVDGNNVLAFGHPFLKRGTVNYFATNAYIFTTVIGQESSFKVGTTGDLVGTITQDRGAGISGQLNQFPYVIPFAVTIQDKDLGRTQESDYQVVQDEELAPILGATGVFNAIDKAMDRQGGGTAKVTFEITGRNLPGETLKRENMFYAPGKISEMAVGEVHEALDLLTSNIFSHVDLFDVKVNVEVEAARKTATILSAKAAKGEAKAGDTVAIDVTLKPYRGAPVVKTVQYQVPKNQSSGNMLLEVRGGGMVPLADLLLKRQGIDVDALRGDAKKRTFASVVNKLATRDRNNDIVVEILENQGEENDGPAIAKGNKATNKTSAATAVSNAKASNDAAKAKVNAATDFVIDGDTQITIMVK